MVGLIRVDSSNERHTVHQRSFAAPSTAFTTAPTITIFRPSICYSPSSTARSSAVNAAKPTTVI